MFQQQHRTADGEVMLVAQMEDKHLLNMIGLIVRRAEQAKQEFARIVHEAEAARDEAQADRVLAQTYRQLYGLPEPPDFKQASNQFATGMNALSLKLEPYLFEAWIRDFGDDEDEFQDLRRRWRIVVGRDEPLPHHSRLALGSPGSFEEDDELPF